MKITANLFKHLNALKSLRDALVSEFEIETTQFEDLSEEQVSLLSSNLNYLLLNYTEDHGSYEPIWEIELSPIKIYGEEGAFFVVEYGERIISFDSLEEATKYADEAYEIYLDSTSED